MTDRDLLGFGQRLREARLSMGLNQDDFSSLGGVKKNSQVLYERGKNAPTVEYLYRLRDQGVDIAYILTGRRQDGSLGFEEKQLFQMFEKLNDRERGIMFTMLAVLSGYVVNSDDVMKMMPLDAFKRAPVTPPTLNTPKRDYRGED